MEVQIEALKRSYPKEGWGHILDMGLGKTTTALNEFCMAVEDFGYRRMLVIAPSNFKPDWEVEAKAFRFPYEFITFESENRDAIWRYIKKYPDKILGMAVNYEALAYPKTKEFLREYLAPLGRYLGIDESIKIKDPNGGFYKNAFEISTKCDMIRLLSGKITTQGAHDTWTQLRILGAVKSFNYYAFRNRYCVMGGFKGKEVIAEKNADELNAYLQKWMFIANNAQYSKRPIPTYTTRPVTMLPEQQAMYDAMEQDFMLEIGEGKIASADMVITRLTKLQQITCGFIIDDDRKVHRLMPIEKNPRINEVIRLLNEEIQGKLIVGAHHNGAIELLMEGLERFNPVSIRGKIHTDRDTVQENKRIFNNDPRCRTIIGQLDATKYGHTLIGDQEDMPCFHNAFFENSFSLDTRSQFERRNDRTGQTYGVVNVDFLSSPMDYRAVGALQRKENVAAAVMGYARERGILAGVKL